MTRVASAKCLMSLSAKCLMSLNSHLLRLVGISPPCFFLTRFIVEQCILKKTSVWPTQFENYQVITYIVLNIVDTRHTVMPWRLSFSKKKTAKRCCFFLQNFKIHTPWHNVQNWASQCIQKERITFYSKSVGIIKNSRITTLERTAAYTSGCLIMPELILHFWWWVFIFNRSLSQWLGMMIAYGVKSTVNVSDP